MESKTVIVLAGHDQAGDPGAIAYDGTKEADLTKDLRDTVVLHLQQMKQSMQRFNTLELTIVTDRDSDKLAQTIAQVNALPKAKDAVGVDIHFNFNHPTASGVEVFVNPYTNETNKTRATWMAVQISSILGIPIRRSVPTRDYKYPNESQHRSLGILDRTLPSMILLEVCFLNAHNLKAYRAKKDQVAYLIAESLLK
jgi:N-acetylmuramoyl-L-alanine amidase